VQINARLSVPHNDDFFARRFHDNFSLGLLGCMIFSETWGDYLGRIGPVYYLIIASPFAPMGLPAVDQAVHWVRQLSVAKDLYPKANSARPFSHLRGEKPGRLPVPTPLCLAWSMMHERILLFASDGLPSNLAFSLIVEPGQQ